jgi:hypothetical protein
VFHSNLAFARPPKNIVAACIVLLEIIHPFGTNLPAKQALRFVQSSFAIPGTLALFITIWMAFHPNFRGFSESLTMVHMEEMSLWYAAALTNSVSAARSSPQKFVWF